MGLCLEEGLVGEGEEGGTSAEGQGKERKGENWESGGVEGGRGGTVAREGEKRS
jgi:hypothetical protein